MDVLDALAAELKCGICLSIAKPPIARLACCHSFCRSCVQQSLRHDPKCPLCKEPASRRDVASDEKLDAIAALFAEMDSGCVFMTQIDIPEGKQAAPTPPLEAECTEPGAQAEPLAAPPSSPPSPSPATGAVDDPESATPTGLEPPGGDGEASRSLPAEDSGQRGMGVETKEGGDSEVVIPDSEQAANGANGGREDGLNTTPAIPAEVEAAGAEGAAEAGDLAIPQRQEEAAGEGKTGHPQPHGRGSKVASKRSRRAQRPSKGDGTHTPTEPTEAAPARDASEPGPSEGGEVKIGSVTAAQSPAEDPKPAAPRRSRRGSKGAEGSAGKQAGPGGAVSAGKAKDSLHVGEGGSGKRDSPADAQPASGQDPPPQSSPLPLWIQKGPAGTQRKAPAGKVRAARRQTAPSSAELPAGLVDAQEGGGVVGGGAVATGGGGEDRVGKKRRKTFAAHSKRREEADGPAAGRAVAAAQGGGGAAKLGQSSAAPAGSRMAEVRTGSNCLLEEGLGCQDSVAMRRSGEGAQRRESQDLGVRQEGDEHGIEAAAAKSGSETKAHRGASEGAAQGVSGAQEGGREKHSSIRRPNPPEERRGRKIPGRLMPWNCHACTFENKGSDAACTMCKTARNQAPAGAQESLENVAPPTGGLRLRMPKGMTKDSAHKAAHRSHSLSLVLQQQAASNQPKPALVSAAPSIASNPNKRRKKVSFEDEQPPASAGEAAVEPVPELVIPDTSEASEGCLTTDPDPLHSPRPKDTDPGVIPDTSEGSDAARIPHRALGGRSKAAPGAKFKPPSVVNPAATTSAPSSRGAAPLGPPRPGFSRGLTGGKGSRKGDPQPAPQGSESGSGSDGCHTSTACGEGSKDAEHDPQQGEAGSRRGGALDKAVRPAAARGPGEGEEAQGVGPGVKSARSRYASAKPVAGSEAGLEAGEAAAGREGSELRGPAKGQAPLEEVAAEAGGGGAGAEGVREGAGLRRRGKRASDPGPLARPAEKKRGRARSRSTLASRRSESPAEPPPQKKQRSAKARGKQGGKAPKDEEVQVAGLRQRPKKGRTQPASPPAAVLMDWSCPASRKWVLLGSGLDQEERQLLRDLSAASGASRVEKFSPAVTHILCGANKEKQGKRTMKLILGVLHGKWLLHTTWAQACLAATRPVPEEPHEVTSDTAGKDSGPILGRMNAGLKLLRGWEVYIYDPRKLHKDYEEVVLAAGAKVLKRIPPSQDFQAAGMEAELAVENGAASIVLVPPEDGGEEEAGFRKEHPRWQGICVNANWLFDSASNYCVQPFLEYAA